MLKFKNNILNQIFSNGISFENPSEIIITLNDNIEIKLEISDCSNYLTINFDDKKYNTGNILSVRVSNLITTNKKPKPVYYISTYDEISFYSDIHSNFQEFKDLSEMSSFSRINAISIVEDLIENENFLIDAAKKNNLLKIEKENKRNQSAELSRLNRIDTHELKYKKIGKEEANLIIKNIENSVFESHESIIQEFLFLTSSGYEINKKISALWENGRLSWRNQKGALMMPEDLLSLIAKSRVEK
jgi:hypothetical protein